MPRRVRVVATGRVQNVGFRVFVLERARALDLHGWVRNLPGGRQIELEAEGDDTAVEQLIGSVRRGPRGARVEDLMVEELATGSVEHGFGVR